MDEKKLIGKFSSSRLFCISAAVIFLIFLPAYLTRELWFDEVLTLQFAALPTIQDIYQSYIIPNNQIVHTWGIHCLMDWGCDPLTMRLFPLLCGGVIVYLLWKNFFRELGNGLLLSLGAWILSPPFLLYATALRGYMLASLLAVCALCAAKKFALGGKFFYLAVWFLFSLLCVGVMPSALAALAAAGLYVLPCCGKKFWKNKKSYLLGIVPFIAFFCFYFPIRADLAKAFALKEGWHDPWYALLAVYGAILITFIVPLIGGIFFHRPKRQHFPRTLIWFLALGGVLLPTAPFPRVWFVLFPFLVLLTAGFLRKMPATYWKYAYCGVLLWGCVTLLVPVRQFISPAFTLAGQDDFYAPRFAGKDFTPSDTACFLQNCQLPVFVSFEADPYCVAYYRTGIIMDIPPGKLKTLPPSAVVVLAKEEDPEVFEKRFQGVMLKIYQNGLHTVYQYRRLL